jgi:hypothetical protein
MEQMSEAVLRLLPIQWFYFWHDQGRMDAVAEIDFVEPQTSYAVQKSAMWIEFLSGLIVMMKLPLCTLHSGGRGK